MILKNIDERIEDLKKLNALLDGNISQELKEKIQLDIKKIQAGLKNEKEVEYELDFNYKNSKFCYVINDLRLEHAGRVAQIDHLIINRFMEFAVCESKSFAEGISYNDNMEFVRFWNSKPIGISSPLEQNNKHILVLETILRDYDDLLPKRLGFKLSPKFLNILVVSKNARINRAKKDLPSLNYIVKSDQLSKLLESSDKERATFGTLAKICSEETTEELAKKIKKLHKPIMFNWAGKYGLDSNFNIEKSESPKVLSPEEKPIEKQMKKDTSKKEENKEKPKYKCAKCNAELENAVVFWCRKNKQKYNGLLLCKEHQKQV